MIHCRARAIVATLAACLAVSGCNLLAPASPTPAPGPTLVPLPAGPYTSQVFKPATTVTLPGGWAVPEDTTTYLQLQPLAFSQGGIHFFRDPKAASQDASCPRTAAPGVATSALGLSNWIRARPGLVVTDPRPSTVAGLPAVEIEIRIINGWTISCPIAGGLPTVPLLVGATGEYTWIVAGSERLRLDLIDLPGGGLLVVDIDDFQGDSYANLLAAATPILASLKVGPALPTIPSLAPASPAASPALPVLPSP